MIDRGETSIIIAAARRIGQSWRVPGHAANPTSNTGSRGPREDVYNRDAIMNVLIVGDGQEETAWGHWFLAHPEYRLASLYPGLPGDDFRGIPDRARP